MKTGRIKRQYVWARTGGFCWYCGARLYLREDADTELKKRLVFTVDHLHPRVQGGRGRANKVPACKYCNSHKSWRSVEQFREWVRARLSGQAKDTVPGGWRINAEGVIFYFELAVLGRAEVKARELRRHPTKLRTMSFFIEPPSGRKWRNSRRNML
jgi:HNH endonuclease